MKELDFTTYYNRKMDDSFISKVLNDYPWLIHFVKNTSELDLQTGHDPKQGRSWFSVYRGTGRVLTFASRRNGYKIDAADAYKKKCDVAIVVSADSDMIPAVELAKEAKQQVFVYFPPNHYSTDLNSICNSTVFLNRYESRFKQCLLPDVVHLEVADYDLHIPEKWKQFQLT